MLPPASQSQRIDVTLGVMKTPYSFPGPSKAVTGKFTRVVTETKIQVTVLSLLVPDSMGNDLASRPTRKVVVESVKRPLRVDSTRSVKRSKESFLLRVDAKNRVVLTAVIASKLFDPFELSVSLGHPNELPCFYKFA